MVQLFLASPLVDPAGEEPPLTGKGNNLVLPTRVVEPTSMALSTGVSAGFHKGY